MTVALVACGQGNSPTATAAEAGPCQIICSDAAPSSFVAIAVSPSSLACGQATSSSNGEDAQTLAVKACGHSDCVPVVWGHDGVAAVAVNRVAYGWGWANDASSTAEARATALCQSRTP